LVIRCWSTSGATGVRSQAALLQTKMGWLYGFERTTGKPLWPMVERPVPASDVPGAGGLADPARAFGHGAVRHGRSSSVTSSSASRRSIAMPAAVVRRIALRRHVHAAVDARARSSSRPRSAAATGRGLVRSSEQPADHQGGEFATILKVIPKTDAADDRQPPKDYLTRPLVGTPYRIEGEIFNSPLGVPCTPPPGAR
jgi:quinoprotein glucose dehydrogenase